MVIQSPENATWRAALAWVPSASSSTGGENSEAKKMRAHSAPSSTSARVWRDCSAPRTVVAGSGETVRVIGSACSNSILGSKQGHLPDLDLEVKTIVYTPTDAARRLMGPL